MCSFIFVSCLILAIAYPSFSCPTVCEKEINLRVYLHQVVEGPTQNQASMVNSTRALSFGTMAVNDWTILVAPNPTATIIARAKGMHVQADQANVAGWFTYLSIVFQDARFSGSTLVTMGMSPQDGQWAIVGGTGEFANAHGIIKFRALPNSPKHQNFKELDIHAFYNPEAVNATGTAVLYI